MYIQIEKTRTDAYIGTFSKSQSDLDELKTIRRIVTNLNKDLKSMGYEYRYYVKCQGRGYRRGNRRYNSSLPLKFAEKFDAYIYNRR